MRKLILPSLFFLCFFSHTEAKTSDSLFPSRTVYFGFSMGGGSTTWKYLVDTRDGQPDPLDASTPVSADEGGPSWGVVAGYDVVKNFALELQYMQFADSKLTFDQFGMISYNLTSPTIVSKTSAYSLSGKYFVRIMQTHFRAFSAVGVGVVERNDVIKKTSAVTPYMSAGLDYNFTRHWIVESGFQYYTGFGTTQYLPVNSFVPFAWDAYGRLAYQL